MAWRMREVVRGSDFPGMRKFDARGVRDVRNHLIQHPDENIAPLAMNMVITDDDLS